MALAAKPTGIREYSTSGGHCRALAFSDGDDDFIQRPDAELLAQRIQNGSHQQRAEKALGHGAEGINAVAAGGDEDVFAFQEFFDFGHFCFIFP